MRHVSTVLSVAMMFTLVAGCATETEGPTPLGTNAFATKEPLSFTEGTVNVDRHFSDSVDVKDDRLVVTSQGNEALLAKLVVGAIVAGDRATGTSDDPSSTKNPYGFLRRVKELHASGTTTVIVTERAELGDWIANGDLLFDDPTSIFSGGSAVLPRSTGIRIQANTGGGSGAATAVIDTLLTDQLAIDGFKVAPVFKLSNASITLGTKFDGYFKVRTTAKVPTSVAYRSHLVLDPVIAADIEAGVRVQGNTGPNEKAVGTVVGVPLWGKSFRGPEVLIPVPGPIPLTVRFAPELKCTLSATGQVTAKVHARIATHAEVGFEGEAGAQGFDLNDLSKAPSSDAELTLMGIEAKATMTAECALFAAPVLLAFDTAGLKGRVGPYVSVSANVCAGANVKEGVDPGFSISEQHGLAGEFAGRVQVPFLGAGKDFDLLSVRALKSEPRYLVGSELSCEIPVIDSCAGRRDGFYCSEMTPSSGFLCEGEQIALGRQCPGTNQRCKSGTKDRITCQ